MILARSDASRHTNVEWLRQYFQRVCSQLTLICSFRTCDVEICSSSRRISISFGRDLGKTQRGDTVRCPKTVLLIQHREQAPRLE